MPNFWIEDGKLCCSGLEPGNMDHAVAKWEFMLDHWKEIRDSGGKDTCALCLAHIQNDCHGCPVAEAVRTGHCWGTPYVEYYMTSEKYGPDEEYGDEVFRAIQAELAFLRDVREEWELWDSSQS